jgi:glycosyltransferase involved in cell wall biosynthesis
VLPIYYHPLTNALNQRLLYRDLQRALRRNGRPADVFWTYWPNSHYLAGRLGQRCAVYHCIDDFTAISYPLTPPGAIARLEAALCRRAHLIFARTEALTAAKQAINAHTIFLPGGVDTTHFDPAQVTAVAPDVAALPQPRVGFVGTLDDRVDITAVALAAAELPQVSFVLVGPIKSHLVNLDMWQQYPNVYFLPARPHTEIPAVVAGFDVCLIPYRHTPYTAGLSPIKLYEYLAMGKAVVAADLPYLRRETAHIALAYAPQEYAAHIRARLDSPPTIAEQVQWRAIAQANSWDKQIDKIEKHLREA